MSRLRELLFRDRPLVMGILNVTPDSFSDGGRFSTIDSALTHAREMASGGADIIDVGGESTRPGANPVSASEEIDRILPVIQAIRRESDVAISVDTSKAQVIHAVQSEDIDLINDVCALRHAGAMDAASQSGIPVCLMHMLGEPRTMQQNPDYGDVVSEVFDFLVDRVSACETAGIPQSRLVLDIGFGFGKSPQDNLRLINQLPRFLELGLPMLVGLSRKSTIGRIVDDPLIGSVSGALFALSKGARILRVHDVAQTISAIKVWQSFAGEHVVNFTI
ncbi:MAG: dihydropteroate synthase [Gammaproteobacteria bacterium]|nr:dihydropteroate synthase [Gammaproteobacteria bacterium]MBT3867524.1 dihydropteroate synthase [Gammaproteobacteria bacterium]MBT4378735.1 dihydropteroate synthase [Gammaproteobacteria bacterium]MBT4617675.1 dihydropteroate synthase [Gammaproteobacteria bacterium]MBT5199005.1 dihydropteroate synthase [Gammaproteobacteria bacterium]